MSEYNHHNAKEPLRVKFFIKISLVIGFLVFLNYGGKLIFERLNFQLWPSQDIMIETALSVSILLYILWMAMPFMPGIELGISLMAVLGVKGVILVYLCTLISLSLSFVIGRLIPLKAFSRFLGWLHLRKAQNLIRQLEPLNSGEKIEFLLKNIPKGILPYLVRHRYLLIAASLNLPGNALIGGGGGIGMIAGISGLYSFPKYIMLISIAITPVPILFLAGKLSV
jgi:hypothetical protein